MDTDSIPNPFDLRGTVEAAGGRAQNVAEKTGFIPFSERDARLAAIAEAAREVV